MVNCMLMNCLLPYLQKIKQYRSAFSDDEASDNEEERPQEETLAENQPTGQSPPAQTDTSVSSDSASQMSPISVSTDQEHTGEDHSPLGSPLATEAAVEMVIHGHKRINIEGNNH